jgi:hypothetical protein
VSVKCGTGSAGVGEGTRPQLTTTEPASTAKTHSQPNRSPAGASRRRTDTVPDQPPLDKVLSGVRPPDTDLRLDGATGKTPDVVPHTE